MLIYVILFIIFAVIAVEYDLKPFNNNYLLLVIVILLGLFAGLRGENVAKDYESYEIIFDFIHTLSTENDGIFLPLFEPGFVAVVLFFRSLFDVNYLLTIMVFFGLLTVTLKVFAINRLSSFPYLAILFYFTHFFFLHEMTQIRIGFASAIFFISLVFYLKGQKVKFILMIFLATLFHYSAIFYLLLLLLKSKYFNRYLYLSLIIIALILGYLKIPFLDFLGSVDPANISGKLNNYTEMVESGIAESLNFFNVLTLLDIVISLYFIFAIPKSLLIKDKIINLSLKCNILSIFFLAFLSGVPSIAFRVSELFGLASIFLYSSLVKYLPFGKLNILATILIAAVTFYIVVFHIDLVHPYYFQHIK